MSAPLPCPVGHYSYMPGQTECKKCNGSSAGRSTVTPIWSRGQPHLGQRSRQLISCPPGTYRDGERSDCVVCPAGESEFQVGLHAFHIQFHILSVYVFLQDITVLQILRYSVRQELMDQRRGYRERGTVQSVLQVLILPYSFTYI